MMRRSDLSERVRHRLPLGVRSWLIRARRDPEGPLGRAPLRFQNARTAPPLVHPGSDEDFSAPEREATSKLTSQLCRHEGIVAPHHVRWARALGEQPGFHRKQWEHTFITQALWERGVLRPGSLGVGFGVGTEPLVALFASHGCRVVATDLSPTDPRVEKWARHDEHASSLEALRRPDICAPEDFDRLVELRETDMNAHSFALRDADFCWSASSLEHLGSIEAGIDFVERSLQVLKPGGVAVHTTELNLSSDRRTITEGPTVLFRRRDLDRLVGRITAARHDVEPLDLDPGDGWTDRVVDLSPYSGRPHTRTAVRDYICTSVGLIATRARRR